MPYRVAGKTCRKLSVIGLGGIVVMNADPRHTEKLVAEAVEKGVNYFDVSPTYGDAELKLGAALKPFRKDCFLACKTGKRDRAGAKQELDNSLKNLGTDYLDLYQLHGMTDVEKDVRAALSKDGAIQTFIEARKAGIVRYLGFSAHTADAALTAMNRFDFDTILYPINFCTHYRSDLDRLVLAQAKKRNMAILAIKAMALQKWHDPEKRKKYPKCWYEPITETALAQKALSWTLAQGVTALLPPGEEALFKIALNLAPHLAKTGTHDTELEAISQKLDPVFGE